MIPLTTYFSYTTYKITTLICAIYLLFWSQFWSPTAIANDAIDLRNLVGKEKKGTAVFRRIDRSGQSGCRENRGADGSGDRCRCRLFVCRREPGHFQPS